MNVDFFTISVVSIEFVGFGVGLWALKKWADRRYNAVREEFRNFQSQADGRINTILNENVSLQEEVDRHRQEFRNFQSQADGRINTLLNENTSLQEEVDRHKEEFRNFQSQADGRINTLLNENTSLRKEVDRNIEEFKAFQSHADRRFNAFAKENVSLRKAVDGYIEENAALQKATQKHTAEIEELRQQNRELQTEFDIMSGRYAELKEQLFPMLEQILDRLAQR